MKRRSLRKTLIPLALFALILLLLRLFVFHTARVEGSSMNVTLKSDEIVLIVKSPFSGTPKRGDVVECCFPKRSGTYLKRVIGLPNETVEIIGGETYIDGTFLPEKYVSSLAEDYRISLEADEYLVLGDNRAESYDSRAEDMGTLSIDNMLGKVCFVLKPFRILNCNY